jgi:hypothetical protein
MSFVRKFAFNIFAWAIVLAVAFPLVLDAGHLGETGL